MPEEGLYNVFTEVTVCFFLKCSAPQTWVLCLELVSK